MLPFAAAPAIIVFILMAFILSYEKILDMLHIPKSSYSYARVIVKQAPRNMHRMFSMAMDFYKICFELDNHVTLDLQVPRKLYESVSVGTRGVLVHTRSRFRGFHADKKIPDIIGRKKSKKGKNDGWRGKSKKNKNGWRTK
jgi:hypothetical protein